MSKLYFRYGAMGASKTANALMVAFNYKEKGMNIMLMKPSIDTRDGNGVLKSRSGLSEPCIMIKDTDVIPLLEADYYRENGFHPDCIIIDEAHFLSKCNVKLLSGITDQLNIPVICYGLRTDFRGNLFEGSKALMEFADTIEEIKTICWCGKKAIMNARIEDGEVIYNGSQVKIGGNETYISLCRKHWEEGRLK